MGTVVTFSASVASASSSCILHIRVYGIRMGRCLIVLKKTGGKEKLRK